MASDQLAARARLHDDYARAFARWAGDEDAVALEQAHEVGRAALRAGLSILDVVEVHGDVVAEFSDAPRSVDASGPFLLEALSVFELARRSFADAHRTVQLEQAHAERLRRLADAAVAVAGTASVEGVLDLTVAATRDLFPGAHVRAVVTATEEGPGAVSGDDDSPEPGLRMPLSGTDGVPLGELVVWPGPERALDRGDQAVLVQLAQMAAVAVGKARLYQYEHRIADTLQRTFLVKQLPSVPGVTLAARYLPAGHGTQVGGDFYDVVALPGGRVALAVGDVTGRGVRAAAVMGQLRIALRAYAVQDLPPADVLGSLDRLLQSLGDAPLATAVFLVVDPASRVARLANAGHPPPLLASDGRARYVDSAVSPPLGVLPDPEYDEAEIVLPTSSTLLLYTDGLVESRDLPLAKGLDHLAAVLGEDERRDRSLGDLCDVVLDRLLPSGTDDDVALLACRLT